MLCEDSCARIIRPNLYSHYTICSQPILHGDCIDKFHNWKTASSRRFQIVWKKNNNFDYVIVYVFVVANVEK